jgi:hypothetical protein
VISNATKTAKKEAAQAEKGKDVPNSPNLMKKMPLKAQEQGFEGKHVKHSDGKTGTADWRNEYGSESEAAPPVPKKSGSISCGLVAAMLLPMAVLFAQ